MTAGWAKALATSLLMAFVTEVCDAS